MSDNLQLAITIMQDNNIDLHRLTGKHNGAMRQRLLTALLGYTVTIRDAGIHNLEREFYRVAGVELDTDRNMALSLSEIIQNYKIGK